MIISCEKCIKKFEISDNLIPEKGRILQCGSCSHKWHYIPKKNISKSNEIKQDKINTDVKETRNKVDVADAPRDEILEEKKTKRQSEKKVGFLSYSLVIIISLTAIIILLDTFKFFFSSYIPNIDFYLSSLYESLKDIFLFLKDLIK